MYKPKVCLWCISSINSADFVERFKEEFDIVSIAIDIQDAKFKYDYTYTIKIPKLFNLKIFRILYSILFILPRMIYLFSKYDKIVDCHIIHYLFEPFTIPIFIVNPKKSILYFTYGSDYRYPSLKYVFKKVLNNKVNLVFSGSRIVKKELELLYGTESSKIDTTLTFGCDTDIFRRFPLNYRNKLRQKYHISNDLFTLFYPRKLTRLYNHHLVLESISFLKNNVREKIKLILINYGDQNYFSELIKLAEKLGIKDNVIIFENRLSKKEMAEIYNISDVTLSIPTNDGIGRSNVEAVLCGSVLLLNKNILNYKILFRDGKYCKYVEPTPQAISAELEDLILRLDELKIESERIRIARFVDWERNKKRIANKIREIIQIQKCGGKNGRG
ncbi:Glycosyltransferase [Geoglobus ahangari]|uniref:Glycosyltransferase n=1 Tax=Geoglobus ahangari TaxID=113653 RepID=A0A0F7IEX7_9EURY|nr:glycosyltransferase [Geoglobus ahangari]AKG91248.1 Glycosyltransferase [Geoglobus ahangari]